MARWGSPAGRWATDRTKGSWGGRAALMAAKDGQPVSECICRLMCAGVDLMQGAMQGEAGARPGSTVYCSAWVAACGAVRAHVRARMIDTVLNLVHLCIDVVFVKLIMSDNLCTGQLS